MDEYTFGPFGLYNSSFNFDSVLEELDPLNDDKVDPSDIDTQFRDLPKLVKGYGFLLACAEKAAEEAEVQVEKMEAVAYNALRSKFNSENIKVTEKTLDNLVKVDEGLLAAKKSLVEAKKQAKLCKTMVAAMSAKQQCLISEATNQRKTNSLETFVAKTR